MTARAVALASPSLPLHTWAEIFVRQLAVQASWNYELLLGTGIGFCLEPALRHLPGGRHGDAYRAAMARESAYFNAHPYLTAVAVGSLARAELERAPAGQIERFRTALCGPLGSVGDRLVWAGWLPFCSLLALAAFGVGAGPLAVLLIFLGLYNVGTRPAVGAFGRLDADAFAAALALRVTRGDLHRAGGGLLADCAPARARPEIEPDSLLGACCGDGCGRDLLTAFTAVSGLALAPAFGPVPLYAGWLDDARSGRCRS